MSHRRLVLLSLVVLALFSAQACARTGAGNIPDDAMGPDAVEADAGNADPATSSNRPPAAKRGNPAPASRSGKSGARGASANPVRSAPRWHRFLPGMFR